MKSYHDGRVVVWGGDCLALMAAMAPDSVDAIVTDPPYGLGFMGKKWDDLPPGKEWAEACYRVLKPGGHVLAFGGTRTWHRLAVAVEDGGFEIRDSLAWLYGSGFPKSMDVSKAIDKAAGAERADLGPGQWAHVKAGGTWRGEVYGDEPGHGLGPRSTAPATPEAEQWQGWGTALKPAHEPVVCGRKPYTVSAILTVIGSQLDALEGLCRQRVIGAARSSVPTRPGVPEATTGIAPASAATQPGVEQARTTATGAAAGSSGQTATSASGSTVETFLSTVMSWRECWDELCALTSTCTTSTETSRTTDLETLSSCLSSLTQSVTAQSTLEPRSWWSLATAADILFAAGVLNWRSTLALSAIGTATGVTPQGSPGAAESSPAFEPIVVGRKPLVGTVAANVLAHGTGALNVDACRVGDGGESQGPRSDHEPSSASRYTNEGAVNIAATPGPRGGSPSGRWPANVVLDESQAAELDRQAPKTGAAAKASGPTLTGETGGSVAYGARKGLDSDPAFHGDIGGASRFMYVAKASKKERPVVELEDGTKVAHPTVKPVAIMRWLVRLVTPPNGLVLDTFAGTGTTGEACVLEGFRCLLAEDPTKGEQDYLPLIDQRITRALLTLPSPEDMDDDETQEQTA